MHKIIEIILISILSSLIIGVFFKLYMDYQVDVLEQDMAKNEIDTRLFKVNYISDNPESPLSVLFLFQLNQPKAANDLLSNLKYQNKSEAIYAEAVIGLESKYLNIKPEAAIKALELLCSKYIEPCVYLGGYFRKHKQYALAITVLEKAESTNEITVFSELRLVYANKLSAFYDSEKANDYANRMSNAIHHLTKTRYDLTLYEQ